MLRMLAALVLAGAAAVASGAQTPAAPGAPKVLRYAFRIAETGFDPAQISDPLAHDHREHLEPPISTNFSPGRCACVR
jgi:hypothetical protein